MHKTTIRNLLLWLTWIIIITITAGLPSGTWPNSAEPWIGPLPFTVIWTALLFIAAYGLLWLSFKEVTEVMEIRTPEEESPKRSASDEEVV